ncbi:cytochrome P450 oxidoreductase [Artomyces pyxidatus]|uniref:Cytochrome P450 oxidoreductase n=1 Tax=Artomyces pyxidatus TaxID=48021 RepID=A0ACB8TI05_9AGAM|nr:cytochrome P450 oxidoreductase [Artomyces pyxidatus]
MLDLPSSAVYGAPLLVLACLIVIGQYRRYSHPLPPGPRGIPFIGNILDLPKDYEWIHWAKHRGLYGPISSVSILGQPVIFLNSLDVCNDLLEKRSSIYSGRPVLPFAGEMIGWNREMILAPYGSRFRALRKLVARQIGSKAAIAAPFVRETQEYETRHFLARVCANPEDMFRDIRLMTAAIFMRISHGYTVSKNSHRPDPLLALLDTAAHEFYLATLPGTWTVDAFPILRHLPAWFPGASFKQTAACFRRTVLASAQKPIEFVKEELREKRALPSFASAGLEDPQVDEDVVVYAAASLFGGGTDTVVATQMTFVLAMILYPDVQKRAQAELDAVLGNEEGTRRLPTFKDRESLLYLEAVYKEVLRWHVIGPMGIPHTSTEDDWYNGYFIPKGSLVFSNIWAISQDTAYYKDPTSFNPDRFMPDTSALDPHVFAFGFGRRKCPGVDMAGANLFIFMALTLSVLEFGPGDGGMPEAEFVSGTVSHPKPFAYSVRPRSKEALSTVKAVHAELPLKESDADKVQSVSTP